MTRVGLLAIQGAYQDHIPHLETLGASCRLVIKPSDLIGCDYLIVPGGESTVMTKFIRAYGLAASIRDRIKTGMAVWGICAGAIVLAKTVDGKPGIIKVLDMDIKRNAYGRQLASSSKLVDLPLLERTGFEAIFIRAPRICSCSPNIKIHGYWGHDPVFVQQGRVMATTFHPELTPDPVFHSYFLNL